MPRRDPFKNFSFLVEIDGVAAAAFTSVSGLAAEAEVIEYRESFGGPQSIKLPGRIALPQRDPPARSHDLARPVELVDRRSATAPFSAARSSSPSSMTPASRCCAGPCGRRGPRSGSSPSSTPRRPRSRSRRSSSPTRGSSSSPRRGKTACSVPVLWACQVKQSPSSPSRGPARQKPGVMPCSGGRPGACAPGSRRSSGAPASAAARPCSPARRASPGAPRSAPRRA